jgi:GTP cyclohydrolase I
MSIDGIADTLEEMADKQGSKHAYCKLRFKYPMTQKALRSRQPLTDEEIEGGHFQELENGDRISLRKLEGHIAYNVTLEGQYHKDNKNQFQFFLTTEYGYSSTCPCSYELSHNAMSNRAAAASAHSQRSIMKTTVEFNANDIVYIEDLIELHRQHIPTEAQVVVRRKDEQAFAELNGANLLFAEDSVRIMVEALNDWYDSEKILDYSIVTEHQESLHPWNAIAMYHKHNDITPI